MTTRYVSNSTANGYAVGVNSGAGTSKSAPWLTLAYAIANCTAGDTIVLNDGAYSETTYLNPTKANLIINGETDYGATFTVTTAGVSARTIYQNASATGLTLGKIIIDSSGGGGQNFAIQADISTAVPALTIHGTKLKNYLQTAIKGGAHLASLVMDSGWEISGAGTVHCIEMLNGDAGTALVLNIDNGTITNTNMGNVTAGVFCNPAAAMASFNATIGAGVVMNLTAANSANKVDGVYLQSVTVADISPSTINIFNSVTPYGVEIPNSTVLGAPNATSVRVHDIAGNLNSSNLTCTSGANIFIGDDTDVTTNQNKLGGVLVYRNNLSGPTHGYAFGMISGAKGWGNKATDNSLLGFLIKGGSGTASNQWFGNLCRIKSSATGSHYYCKGASGTGNGFYNNTSILDTGFIPSAVYNITANNALNAANCEYKNNNIYIHDTPTKIAFIDVGQAAVFGNNNYYSEVALPANVFSYTGTGYNTIAAWTAAQETTATNIAPGFTNFSGSDYSLSSTSGILNVGVKWWGTSARPSGLGEPYPDFDIDIGAYQSKWGKFHPSNLHT